jgi:hypothetical protein
MGTPTAPSQGPAPIDQPAKGAEFCALIHRSENSDDVRDISLDMFPMSRWFELARGIEVWVFAAHSRRVPSTKTKVLPVYQLVPRLWGGIVGRPVKLIIRSAIIRLIMGSAVVASRPDNARVLSEHRRGNGGGKNYHST